MKKNLLITYGILSMVGVLDLAFYYFYQISFAGYYSDVIIFWMWLLCTFTVIIIFWKKIAAKILLVMMILALVLSILPMMLPFFSVFFSMTPFGLRMKKNLNENYRVQIVGYSVMIGPWLEIIEKKGIFEKRVSKISDIEFSNFDHQQRIGHAKDLYFKEETDSTVVITLFYGEPNFTLTINKNNGDLVKISK